MARGRKSNSKDAGNAAATLLQALRFIAPVMKDKGNVRETHAKIAYGWLAASNDLLTIGTKVSDDIDSAPHYFKLVHALSNCGTEVSITQFDADTVIVKSGRFRAKIPCLPSQDIPISGPNPLMGPAGESIVEAIKVVSTLAGDADRPVLKAVCLGPNVALATNGYAAIGHWHGVPLPCDLLMPPEAVKAVSQCAKQLVGIGFSDTAITFHYEDESFIKCQRFLDKYPDVSRVLRPNFPYESAPDKFFESIKIVHPASETGYVYFIDGVISSHRDIEMKGAASVEFLLPSNSEGQAFRADTLLDISKFCDKIGFDDKERKMYFSSDKTTGVLMGLQPFKKQPKSDLDDDIPF